MRQLSSLSSLAVPPPRPDETYRLSGLGTDICFSGLKALLGAADYSKAGDRNAGCDHLRVFPAVGLILPLDARQDFRWQDVPVEDGRLAFDLFS